MITVERVQTGVRMERRMVKVLKGLAEYLDISLGDLLEGIVLHAFEQKVPFSDATLVVVGRLKEVYGLDLTAADSHHAHQPGRGRRGVTALRARPGDRQLPGGPCPR